MTLTAAEKIDLTNIGLMVVAACAAMVLPFELFLFSYSILGPLHYLTEISWLHDKKYYTREKHDALLLLAIGILITVNFFRKNLDLELPEHLDANLVYIALFGAVILVTIKNKLYRISGFIFLVLTSQISNQFLLLLTVFIPTLVHVYLFTIVFMLYGALKSQSRFGIPAVIAMVVCPILLAVVFPDRGFFPPTAYGKHTYEFFKMVNIAWLVNVNDIGPQKDLAAWDHIVYYSREGVVLMRFIAFAYTYHYFNWFSKTRIIEWHKVPRARFALVIVIWLISVGLYIKDYQLGIKWLVFISFMHVLLEFPLNMLSIIGIGSYFKDRLLRREVPAKCPQSEREVNAK